MSFDIVHPGEILLTEFLEPNDTSQSELARRINVDKRRVNDLIHGRRSITPDTATRLSAFFGTTTEFWLLMQMRYDLDNVARDGEDQIREQVKKL